MVSLVLAPPLASANGMFFGPEEVYIQEAGQNAIVAWNGDEEILILSIDAKTSANTSVLHGFPLPSTPEVEEGNFSSFTKLTEIVNQKLERLWYLQGLLQVSGMPFGMMGAVEGEAPPGVEITLHEKIGLHDVTVVKINDLDYFITWVNDFTECKGLKNLENIEFSSEFKNTVADYLNRDIRFFVFDVIETSNETQSVNPLIYRFKTDYLYYPLEATAKSDAGQSISKINLFLITNKKIDEKPIRDINLSTTWTYGFDLRLNKMELRKVSLKISDLFKSKPAPFVINAHYRGPLDRLNKDLVVY